jgi:hypothetical protein
MFDIENKKKKRQTMEFEKKFGKGSYIDKHAT